MSSLQPPCNLGITDATTHQSFWNLSRVLWGAGTHVCLILEAVLHLISTLHASLELTRGRAPGRAVCQGLFWLATWPCTSIPCSSVLTQPTASSTFQWRVCTSRCEAHMRKATARGGKPVQITTILPQGGDGQGGLTQL